MAAKSLRFTKTVIDKLPIPTTAEAGSAGYVMYWDTAVTGFGVLVRPSGLMTFILAYRNQQGRVRRLTIGRYGRVTVEQAREAAKQHNGRIVLGDDPVETKSRDRSVKSVDEVLSEYQKKHIEPNCSDYARRSIERVRLLIRETIGSIPISKLESADLLRCLDQFLKKKGNYNLILTYMRAAWNWAHDRRFGLGKDDAENPTDGIEPIASTPQARAITGAEYRVVFRTIDELMEVRRNDPARLLACLFVIETGCRPIEAVRLRRDKVFWERGIAELYDHKTFRRTGTPKHFFLTPSVLRILKRAEALHVMRNSNSVYVFPRRGNQKAANWLAKTWNSVRKKAGVNLELRHFRSGYINLADDLGLSLNSIADMTQHASVGTIRRHYRVVRQKRASLDASKLSDRIEEFRNSKQE
jgi:integrase